VLADPQGTAKGVGLLISSSENPVMRKFNFGKFHFYILG
jgi:hypothetical protein